MIHYYVDLATQGYVDFLCKYFVKCFGAFFFHALLSLEKALKASLALSKFSTWKSREGRRHPQAGDLQAINEIYFDIFCVPDSTLASVKTVKSSLFRKCLNKLLSAYLKGVAIASSIKFLFVVFQSCLWCEKSLIVKLLRNMKVLQTVFRKYSN